MAYPKLNRHTKKESILQSLSIDIPNLFYPKKRLWNYFNRIAFEEISLNGFVLTIKNTMEQDYAEINKTEYEYIEITVKKKKTSFK